MPQLSLELTLKPRSRPGKDIGKAECPERAEVQLSVVWHDKEFEMRGRMFWAAIGIGVGVCIGVSASHLISRAHLRTMLPNQTPNDATQLVPLAVGERILIIKESSPDVSEESYAIWDCRQGEPLASFVIDKATEALCERALYGGGDFQCASVSLDVQSHRLRKLTAVTRAAQGAGDWGHELVQDSNGDGLFDRMVDQPLRPNFAGDRGGVLLRTGKTTWISAIRRNGVDGIVGDGKWEPLKLGKDGYWAPAG